MTEIIDDYIVRNEGRFTASKLKLFGKNPEEFYLQYVKKIYIPNKKRHFIFGNAFDYLMTCRILYGNNAAYDYENNPLFDLAMGVQVKQRERQEIPEDQYRLTKRLETYYMDEGLVVDDLKKELLAIPQEDRYGYSDGAIKKAGLHELRRLFYKDPSKKKVRLTPGEADKLMGMYREVIRQPKMDMF